MNSEWLPRHPAVAYLVLVRPMSRCLHTALLPAFVVALLNACATPIEFLGTYRLPRADVEQIKALTIQRLGPKKPVSEINATKPDEAEVTAGRCSYAGDVCTRFTVRKRHGHWLITSKITEEQIIVTGS